MSFNILFHPDVANDVAALPADMKERIRNTIKERLTSAPALYGKPLRATLKGYWKLRVADYRVVYGISVADVVVYAILHRRHVYNHVHKRFD